MGNNCCTTCEMEGDSKTEQKMVQDKEMSMME